MLLLKLSFLSGQEMVCLERHKWRLERLLAANSLVKTWLNFRFLGRVEAIDYHLLVYLSPALLSSGQPQPKSSVRQTMIKVAPMLQALQHRIRLDQLYRMYHSQKHWKWTCYFGCFCRDCYSCYVSVSNQRQFNCHGQYLRLWLLICEFIQLIKLFADSCL